MANNNMKNYIPKNIFRFTVTNKTIFNVIITLSALISVIIISHFNMSLYQASSEKSYPFKQGYINAPYTYKYVCTINKVSNLVCVMVDCTQQQDNNSFQIFKLVTSPHILDNSPSISSPIYSKVIIHICMGIQRHCPFFYIFCLLANVYPQLQMHLCMNFVPLSFIK